MKKITFLAAALFAIAIGQAQTTRTVFGHEASVNPANGLIRCVSDQYEKHLQELDPNRASSEQFEQWLAPKVAEARQRMASGKNVAVVVTIPVVVHVIHNGDAVGFNENISAARVQSQITVLNNDFRKILGTPGYNTNAVGADVEIEFCLAQRTPQGVATNGINRVNLGMASWSTRSSVQNTLKPQTIWDPTQYLNIWVAQFTDNINLELGGILGYAQFPSASGLPGLNLSGGAANTDGVIIDWRCFGSSDYAAGSYFTTYDKGRTTTHEVGHFFGLRHIWGDAGNQTEGIDCSGDDFCADTPVAGWENYDCLTTYNSCPAPGNDMVENYMDYTNDTCMNIFTLDQKARVMAVLQNSPRRSSLGSSVACSALSTPGFDKLQGLNLYPNPANDFVNIGNSGDLPESYSVVNALGQLVATKTIASEADLTISTSQLVPGVYFVTVKKDTAVKTLRFVKN